MLACVICFERSCDVFVSHTFLDGGDESRPIDRIIALMVLFETSRKLVNVCDAYPVVLTELAWNASVPLWNFVPKVLLSIRLACLCGAAMCHGNDNRKPEIR